MTPTPTHAQLWEGWTPEHSRILTGWMTLTTTKGDPLFTAVPNAEELGFAVVLSVLVVEQTMFMHGERAFVFRRLKRAREEGRDHPAIDWYGLQPAPPEGGAPLNENPPN